MNLLTDYRGRYAYIDYEMGRHFSNSSSALVYNYRGTELPPESERGGGIDPYRVDVWALGVLILRACKVGGLSSTELSRTLTYFFHQSTGFWVPELMNVIKPMLEEEPSRRPSSLGALHAFNKMVSSLGYRLEPCDESH